MASARRRARFGRLLPLSLLASVALAPAAHALRLVNYNLHDYPGTTGPARGAYFRTILAPLAADVVVVQEMQSQAGVDSFRTNVLNVLEPGQWLSAPFVNGNDTDNALFYKPSKVDFLGSWTFYPNSASLLRLVACYRLRPVGYLGEAAELRIYSQHLKASQGTTEAAQRLAEATGIRDSMNAIPPGTHAILLGDFNIYTSTEGAYQKFLESQADNDGRLFDPLNPSNVTQNWHDGGTFAPIHTQCPCIATTSGGHCPGGFSGGGMDDRFDMFLPTLSTTDGEGLDIVPSSYVAVGQDGQHFNLEITAGAVIPEGPAYANALLNASDHLPIRIDLQVPAKIAVDTSPIDMGTAIVGATPLPTRDLAIDNPAVAPADELTLTFSTTPGFQAPAATTVAPGGTSANTIRLGTGIAGFKNGTLTITSDDPDAPTTNVALSGTVLNHAQASLDSLDDVVADTLDFGTHEGGAFEPLLAAVHDRGYDPLRARLAVSDATIDGGDGRFTIAGFGATLVAGTAARWNVSFDDAGATPDSDYAATLTFASADEPLPGAVAQPTLTYTLLARVAGNTVGVEAAAPAFSRLYAPSPNPASGGTTVRFDLARAGRARLEVFDLGGRRVAQLADRDFDAGSYRFRWDGRDESGGRAGAGLYFVRLTAPGLRSAERIAVVR